MVGLWLLSLPALALRADPSVFLGTEPVRIRRFHKERQSSLRRGKRWSAFVGGIGHGWVARFDERTGAPMAAWGPSIPLGKVADMQTMEARVREVFAQAPGLLGVPADQLSLGRSGYVESSDTWHIHFDQVLPGTDIAVYRGGVSVRVKNGNLVSFGVDTYPELGALDARPGLAAAAAEWVATSSGPAGNGQHEEVQSALVVLPIDANPEIHTRLAWKVQSKTDTPKGHWVSFVDAQTGELLNVHNEVRFVSGTVTAEHDVRTVDGEKMVSPLPWLRIQMEGAATYADEDGNWELDGDGETESDLIGEFVRIHNEQGDDAEFWDMGGTVLLTDDDASQAELSAYVFQSQVRTWALEYAPDIAFVNSRIDTYVNINENCNAYFDGNLNFMRAGSGCANTGRIADVNYHEWGHGFHYYSLVSGEFDGSMSEGIADIVSVLNTADPVISPGFFDSGEGIRNVGPNRVYPDDWVGEVHTDGLIFAGAVWDLVGELTEDLGEEEAYHKTSQLLAAAVKSGPTTPQAFDAFILADDDNGDLSDGTPNSCAIIQAFSLHGLGPGGDGGSVIVLDHDSISAHPPESDISLSLSAVNLAPECVDATVDSAQVHYSVDDGESWDTVGLTGDMEGLIGVLPGQPEGTILSYYFSLDSADAGTSYAPSGSTINPYTLTIGTLKELYCEDFEADDGGYTHALISGSNDEGADDWMWATPLGLGGDPDFAFSGNKAWGNDLGGGQYNGEYQNDKVNRLTSVDIEVGEETELVLQYRRWLNVEDGYYDQANVLANGELVWTNYSSDRESGTDHHQDDQWMLHSIPIEADDSGVLTIEWEIDTDRGLSMGGWTIDDVCVYALTDAVSTDPGDEPGDETDPGNDSPGGEVGDYDVPERSGVIEGKRVGCSCASAPDPAQLGWLGLLLTGLITAARRREG